MPLLLTIVMMHDASLESVGRCKTARCACLLIAARQNWPPRTRALRTACFHLGGNQGPVQPAALALVTWAGTGSAKAATGSIRRWVREMQAIVFCLESPQAVRDRAC